MKYELQYAQTRPALFDKETSIHERRTTIIEEESYDAAEKAAAMFLAGRTMISLRCLHLPEPSTVLQPKPEFIPEDELYEYERS